MKALRKKQYTTFAEFYDEMMDNIPYYEWESYLLQLLYLNNAKPDAKVLELGCGTGTMTQLMRSDGFDVTGVDISEEMIRLAKQKCPSASLKQMDMRDLTLDKTFDVAICVCDGMNYMENVTDLSKVMKGVYEVLSPGGFFIFDLKTEYLFKHIIKNRTFRGRGQGYSYVWKNFYTEDSRLHIYDVFIKHRLPNGKRVTENEVHKQHVFTASEIKEAAIFGGFRSAKVYGDMTLEKPRKNSERIYLVLNK